MPYNSDLSITQSTEPEGNIGFPVTQTTTNVQPLSADDLAHRVTQYDVAFGSKSPGTQFITQSLQSGHEDALLHMLKGAADFQGQQAAQSLALSHVMSGMAETDPGLTTHLLQHQANEENGLMERKFVENANDLTSSMVDSPDHQDAKQLDPATHQSFGDPFEDTAIKRNIVYSLARVNEQEQKKQGWGGWAADEVKQWTWFPSWSNLNAGLNTAGEVRGTFLLPGTKMEKKLADLYALPPAEFQKQTEQIYMQLRQFNLKDAEYFVNALQSYTPMDSLMQDANVATLIPVGGIAKGIVKGGKFVLGSLKRGATEAVTEAATESTIRARVAATKAEAEAAAKAVPIEHDVEAAAKSVNTALGEHAPLEEVLASTGNTEDAARVMSQNSILSTLGESTPEGLRQQFAALLAKTPSLFSTDAWTTGARRLVGNGASLLADTQRAVLKNMARVMGGDGSPSILLDRIPQSAYPVAADEALRIMKANTPSINDKIMAVRHVLPEMTGMLNTGMLEVTLGRNAVENFATRVEAEQAAVAMGLPSQSYTVATQGQRYVVKAFKYVAENPDRVIDDSFPVLNKAPQTNWGVFKSLVGLVANGKINNAAFQNMQRAGLVHGHSALQSLIKEIYAPLKALNKGERKDLDKIMMINRDTEAIPGYPNTRGMYYNNIAELEKAYMSNLKRLPSLREINAYFSMVRASDVDWVFRSFAELKRKAVQGFENPTFYRLESAASATSPGQMQGFQIEARQIESGGWDRILDSRLPLTIAVKDQSTGLVNKFDMRKLADTARQNLRQMLVDGKLKMYQPYKSNHEDLMAWGVHDGPIDYILDVPGEVNPLDLTKQVNYRRGFHNDYKAEWFVKQPEVKDGRFMGDKTALASSSEVKAHEDAKIWETARQLLVKGDMAGLKAHLAATTDVTPKQFIGFFKDPTNPLSEGLDRNTPFMVVKRGGKSYDSGMAFANGQKWDQVFKTPIDTDVARFHNPSGEWGGDAFVARRDPQVLSLSKDTESQPVRKLAMGEQFSPMFTQARAMRELINHALYDDYQMTAARNYVDAFAGKLLYNGRAVTTQELRQNPIFYLFNADVAGGLKERAQAFSLKASIQQLMGMPSWSAQVVDTLKQKLWNGAYRLGGERLLDYVPEKMLPGIVDPTQALKQLATHSKLGMLNIGQYWVQASAVLNTAMMHPVYSPSMFVGSIAANLVHKAPQVLDKMASIAAKVGPHWTEDKFKEAYSMLHATMFDKVGGEHSWKLDWADPKLYRDNWGRQVLDAGLFAFNRGESTVRRTGFMMSYLEHAAANPGKIGKMGREDLQMIMNKAQTYTANMTRNSSAWWQDGLAGNITQFMSYTVRMAELMLGHELSGAERARLGFGNMILYGFGPLAAGAAAVGYADPGALWTQLPWGSEDLQTYMAEKYKVNIDDNIIGAMNQGAISSLLYLISGQHFDIGSRYGMSPIHLFDQIKKNEQEHGALYGAIISLLGPSGNIGADFIKQAMPLYHDVADILGGKAPVGTYMLKQDFIDATRSITGINNSFRLYMAANNEYIRSQSGKLMGKPGDNFNEIVKALTGVQTTTESWAYNLKDTELALQENHKAVADEATRYTGMYFDALDGPNPNPEAAGQAIARAYMLMKAANFTELEIHGILFPQNGRLHEKLTDTILNHLKGFTQEGKQNITDVITQEEMNK